MFPTVTIFTIVARNFKDHSDLYEYEKTSERSCFLGQCYCYSIVSFSVCTFPAFCTFLFRFHHQFTYAYHSVSTLSTLR